MTGLVTCPGEAGVVLMWGVLVLALTQAVTLPSVLELTHVMAPNGRRCYYEPTEGAGDCYAVGGAVTWAEARLACSGVGGALVDTPGKSTTAVIHQVLSQERVVEAWLAMTKLTVPWTWTDDQYQGDVSGLRWSPDEPSVVELGADCVYLDTAQGYSLSTAACHHRVGGYVCQTALNSSTCQHSGSTFTEVVDVGDTCYLFTDASRDPAENVTWFSAEHACARFGGARLASITPQAQERIRAAAPGSDQRIRAFWLGLTRARWTSANDSLTQFPANTSCVRLWASTGVVGSLVAADCFSPAEYICAIKISNLLRHPTSSVDTPTSVSSLTPDTSTVHVSPATPAGTSIDTATHDTTGSNCEGSATIVFLLTFTDNSVQDEDKTQLIVNNVTKRLSHQHKPCFDITVRSFPMDDDTDNVSAVLLVVVISTCNPYSVQYDWESQIVNRKGILVCLGTADELTSAERRDLFSRFQLVLFTEDVDRLNDISDLITSRLLILYQETLNYSHKYTTVSMETTTTSLTSLTGGSTVMEALEEEKSYIFIILVITIPCVLVVITVTVITVVVLRKKKGLKKYSSDVEVLSRDAVERISRGSRRTKKSLPTTLARLTAKRRLRRGRQGIVKVRPPRPGPTVTDNAPNQLFYNCLNFHGKT